MPTPVENGQTVLEIYHHFDSRAGHVLLANNFVAIAARRHIPISDVQMGIEYAVHAGWIQQTPRGLMLTEDGAAAIEHAS